MNRNYAGYKPIKKVLIQKSIKKITDGLIYLGILIIPILFSSSTMDPTLLPRFLAWSILTFVILLFVALALRWNPNVYDFSVLRRPVFFLFLSYLGITAVSLINTINFSEGLFEWLKFFLFLIFLSISCLIIGGDKNRILHLAKAFVVLGALLAAIGICQYYQLAFTSIPGNYVIYATMAHKNLLASSLFLILPFVLYGNFTLSGLWQMMSLVAIAIILFCIFFTGARTVWMAITCGAFLTAMIWAAKIRKTGIRRYHRRLDLRNCVGFLCAGLILISIVAWSYNHNNHRLSSIASENKISPSQVHPLTESVFRLSTVHERIWLWQISWEMIKAYPLLGVGLGQWKIHFPDYAKIQKLRTSDENIKEIVFQRPHNDYVWVLAESGFLGLSFFLAVIIIPVFYCLKIFFKANDRNSKNLAGFMMFGLIGYMIISFFSFPKERIVHLIFLSLIIACVVSTYHASFPDKNRTGNPKSGVLSGVAMLLLALCVFIGYVRLQSEIHARSALRAHQQENWQTVVSEIERANTLLYQLDPASTPIHWYKGVANYSMGRFKEALNDFTTAHQAHPYHYHVLNNLGSSYAKLGDYRRAVEFYKKALDAYPGFQDAIINLGIVYYHMGDLEKAYDCLIHYKPMQDDIRAFVYMNLIEDRLNGKNIAY